MSRFLGETKLPHRRRKFPSPSRYGMQSATGRNPLEACIGSERCCGSKRQSTAHSPRKHQESPGQLRPYHNGRPAAMVFHYFSPLGNRLGGGAAGGGPLFIDPQSRPARFFPRAAFLRARPIPAILCLPHFHAGRKRSRIATVPAESSSWRRRNYLLAMGRFSTYASYGRGSSLHNSHSRDPAPTNSLQLDGKPAHWRSMNARSRDWRSATATLKRPPINQSPVSSAPLIADQRRYLDDWPDRAPRGSQGLPAVEPPQRPQLSFDHRDQSCGQEEDTQNPKNAVGQLWWSSPSSPPCCSSWCSD